MGGGGDLAKRKLLPAAYNLALDAVLPENFVIFGFGRRELSDDEYRSFAREGIDTHSRRPLEDKHWAKFEC
jgi:glucose-6-phosphate 1-dehydrogenase